jgi:hypothetical protein
VLSACKRCSVKLKKSGAFFGEIFTGVSFKELRTTIGLRPMVLDCDIAGPADLKFIQHYCIVLWY